MMLFDSFNLGIYAMSRHVIYVSKVIILVLMTFNIYCADNAKGKIMLKRPAQYAKDDMYLLGLRGKSDEDFANQRYDLPYERLSLIHSSRHSLSLQKQQAILLFLQGEKSFILGPLRLAIRGKDSFYDCL